jgi:deoxyhypusine monooxygenase
MATATSSHSSSSSGVECTMDTNNHHHSSVSHIDVARVGQVLNDEAQPMKARFRALFILRNVSGAQSIDAITRCFTSDSALLKHELAYVLGQMQDTSAVPKLISVLDNVHENPMVRHEAGW